MQMVNDAKSHKKFWAKYEATTNGQPLFFGGHSTRTDSLNNMPNGIILGTQMGTMCITSDAQAFIWDSILNEWIKQ